MIGKKIHPILSELEGAIIEYNYYDGRKPNYPVESIPAATMIFMSVLMDKMWEVQEFDKMDNVDREKMAEKAGEEIRRIIKTYTGLDSHNFYNIEAK
jgi:hypothetical protein